MKFDIQHRPSFALAIVHLDEGETVISEGGAMVSMDANIKLETGMKKKEGGMLGGLLGGLKRMLAGESFFQNRFTAEGKPGHVTFAPTFAGDVVVHEMDGSTGMVLQQSAFLCSGTEVEIDAKWKGGKGFFAGESSVMLKASGSGPIAFNSFGGIKEIEVDGTFIVDTGHIVAFEDTVDYTISKFGGGWKAFIFGGEGLVCTFKGKGKLWIQTRNPQGFGQELGSKLPPRPA